jgi:hypothetical protein
MRVAICYWGVLRTFRITSSNHKKNILDVLRDYNIDFDIYMHTWKGSLVNKRGNSSQLYSFSTDVSDLVSLHQQKVDDQDEFLSTLNLDHYFYKDVYEKIGNSANGEWLPEMVTYQLCSQESQKRVVNMVFTSGISYDRIILLRPDIEMSIPLRILPIMSMTPKDIILPSDEHNDGYNDRFAIMSPQMVLYYSNRIDEAREFRSLHGRLVGEKYVKYILDKYKFTVKFENISSSIVR